MAVFRIERTRDYTVMSNHHLRNANLSLKAKGLLSMMLSLPEDWNYTTRGLAKICKEGVDAIGAALRELEAAGYIVRHKLRDRQPKIHLRSHSHLRLDADGMRKFLHDLAAQIQSDARRPLVCAAVAARVAFFENPRQILRRNADAGVLNHQRFWCIR